MSCCKNKDTCNNIINNYIQAYTTLFSNISNSDGLEIEQSSASNYGVAVAAEQNIRNIANNLLLKNKCNYTIPAPNQKSISAIITNVCVTSTSSPPPIYNLLISITIFQQGFTTSDNLYYQLIVQDQLGLFPTATTPSLLTISSSSFTLDVPVNSIAFVGQIVPIITLYIATTAGMGSSIIYKEKVSIQEAPSCN